MLLIDTARHARTMFSAVLGHTFVLISAHDRPRPQGALRLAPKNAKQPVAAMRATSNSPTANGAEKLVVLGGDAITTSTWHENEA